MANAPKMKIPIGADTADFEKGARKVKQEMRDLNKVSSDALSAIGSALGVDTGKLQQFSSALTGVGRTLQNTGTEGQKAFGAILQSIGPVAGAIAGLGIGAATLAFKSLTAEAEAFRNTVEGVNMEMATAAYIDTYRQALRDLNGQTGQAMAETQSNWKKFWQTLGSNVKQFFVSGAFSETMSSLEGSFTGGNFTQATEDFSAALDKANDKARTSEEITREIGRLEQKRREQGVELSKINSEIADKMGIARDATASIASRQQAIADVDSLIEQKKEKSVSLEQQLAVLYRQRANLATSSEKQVNEALAQEQLAYDTERAVQLEANSLLKIKNSIAKSAASSAASAQAEAEATRKAAEALEKAKKLLQGGGALESPSSSIATPLVPVEMPVNLAKPTNVKEWEYEIVKSLGPGLNIGIAFDVDAKKIHDVTKEIENLVENMATSVGEAVGELAANLINGEDAWSSFGNAALSAFGDMAVTVGKMAIATGTATLGIKAALESLDGWVAIAAGVALVALGSAVKAGLSNVASGNYSAGSGVATSTSTNRGTGLSKDYSTREMNVKVTGTLVGQGSSLVAVINNENNRRSHTT